jgi:hydrogenase maturation protease
MTGEDVLIIGYGSELRGDDAAGRLAARRLAERGYRALDVHQLTPELAENVAAARLAIFLDAHQDVAPGEIVTQVVEEGVMKSGALEHHASPSSLLRLAREVYGRAPKAWLIGMGGSDFEVGERLSAAAEAAIRAAVDEAVRLAGQQS